VAVSAMSYKGFTVRSLSENFCSFFRTDLATVK